MSQFDVAATFRQEFTQAVQEEAVKSGFPVENWMYSGRLNGPDSVARWLETGPEWVQNFIDWYEMNPDVQIWTTPDGIPAVELPIEVMFGEVLVRGYIDLVLQLGSALVVTDIKTSAKVPVSHRQLGIYASGIELKYGSQYRPRYGTFFMCRGIGPKDGPKTYFQRPVELDKPQYSVPYLTAEFAQAERGIQAGVFPAAPGDQCGRCGVAHACTEVGGPKARELDLNWPWRAKP